MMKDNSRFNEYMLAYRLKMKHSDVMMMTNSEYLDWQAYFKRRAAESHS